MTLTAGKARQLGHLAGQGVEPEPGERGGSEALGVLDLLIREVVRRERRELGGLRALLAGQRLVLRRRFAPRRSLLLVLRA